MSQGNLSKVHELSVAARQMRQLISDKYFALLGLNDSAVLLLGQLSRSSSMGSTQAQLAVELSISESSLCSLVEKLRLAGLIERTPSVADRRKSNLCLTSSGQKVLEQVKLFDEQIVSEASRQLSNVFSSNVVSLLMHFNDVLRTLYIENSEARRAA